MSESEQEGTEQESTEEEQTDAQGQPVDPEGGESGDESSEASE
jgi:hypothetical protein